MASNPYPDRKYLCDWRGDATDASMYVSAITSEHPTVNISNTQDHHTTPSIPTGRIVVTVGNVDPDLHDAIMEIPGVSIYED